VLGTLVRAHRRKFPHAAIRALPRRRGRAVERLAILLRLAVVLHRSRSPYPIPRLQLEAGKKSLRVGFPAGWLDRNPLTRADLDLECDYLGEAELRLQFT
jgi:exopolyphosphatase/guanosine-5'-triphosphate,3'-diphosphate pyrophosphatase